MLPIARAYQVLPRTARNVLHAQMAAETIQISAKLETIACIDADSESLYGECERIWPLIASAKAEVAAAEATIVQTGPRLTEVRGALTEYRDRKEAIRRTIQSWPPPER